MSAGRINRLARWLPLIALAGILGAGLIALRAQGSFEEHLRRAVSWEFSRSLGRRVRLRESGLYLVRRESGGGQRALHIGLRTRGLRVEEAPGAISPRGGEKPFLRVSELSLEWEARGLLRSGGFVSGLREMRVVRPQARIERDAKGRWNFADLLARKPAPKARLKAKIEVVDGRLLLSDSSPPKGLKAPQENRLEGLNLLVSMSRPGSDEAAAGATPSQISFRLWATNPEGRAGRIFASGRSLSYSGEQNSSRLNGSIVATGADLGYLWRYRALTPKLEMASGRGDIVGSFRVGRKEGGPASLDYAFTVAGRQAQLSVPWVKGEVRDASGLVRISNGLVQLSDLEGRLGQARVEGEGYLMAASAKGMAAESASPPGESSRSAGTAKPRRGYALHFTAQNVSGNEISRVLPGTAAANFSRRLGRGAFAMNVAGRGKEAATFGSLSSPGLEIGSVGKGRAPETREVKAEFVYYQQGLGAVAKGKMLGGDAEGAVFLAPSAKGEFAASLERIALSAVPLSGAAALTGEAWANLRGEFALSSEEGGRTSSSVSGSLALVGGEVRARMNQSAPASFPFERIRADFSYGKEGVFFPQARVETDYGAFDLAGRLSESGGIEASLEGRGIDLRKVGEVFGEELGGTAFVSAQVRGTRRRPQMELRGDIFSGEIRGYGYDWLGGDLALRGREVPHFEFVFQRGSGEGRFRGEALLPTAGDAGRITAEGKIEKAQLAEWLPERLRERAKGVFDAQVKIRGAPDSPQMEASFQVSRPRLAGMQFDVAEGELGYQDGVLGLPRFEARVNGSQFSASGEMRRSGELGIDFSAERLRLAPLLESLPSVPADGWLSLQGRVEGKRDSPRLEARLKAEAVTFAQQRAGDIEADLAWNGNSLVIRDFDFSARGGHLRLAGDLTRPRPAGLGEKGGWETRLQADSTGMEVGFLVELLEKGLQATPSEGTGGRLLEALGKIPRPVRGFLTASSSIFGPLASPRGEVEFALSEGSLAGEHLPSLEGRLGFSRERVEIKSFVAREGEAFATAFGGIDFAGETDLNVDVHNLGAEVLSPWVRGVSGLGGSADIYLRIQGPSREPIFRGDLEVSDPVIGKARLERVKIDRFVLSSNRLEIENLRLVKGPHLAKISASLPYSWREARLEESGAVQGELLLEGQDLSFITSLWPGLGEFSGPLEARLEIGGDISRPRLEEGSIYASGLWEQASRQAKIGLEGKVVNHVLRLESASGNPGVAIALEKKVDGKAIPQGRLEGSGYYDPFAGPRGRWGLGAYEIGLKAEELEGEIGESISGRVDGELTLRGDPKAAEVDKIWGKARVSRGRVSIPRKGLGGEISWRPRYSPYVEVEVQAEGVEVSTRTARVELAGGGIIGGRLGYEPLAVEMKLKAKRGVLDFPAAVAEVQKMEVTISKRPEEPLRALGHVEAMARVGRYRVDLSGGGLLFPSSELRINATASPPLTEAQASALLLGVPPSTLGREGEPAEEALGQQVAESLSSSVTALAATGFSAPLLKAVGLNELSFAISPVSTRLQLGKRLAERVYIYYLSSLGGASEASLMRIILDLTPGLSVGFSVNELQQYRYELQTTKRF